MTPRTCTIAFVFSALLGATATSALAADPTGDWRVADGVATIRVAECQGSLWGAVSWEQIPGGKDKYNPDPAKASRPTLGMPILLDMQKQPDGQSWKGTVYNAKDGKSYDSTITPVGNDQLKIQGCVLGFLCGGETWTRVGPPIPASAKAGKTQPARTVGSVATQPAMPGSAASATTGRSASKPGDIGDVCLLPDVPRLAH